MLSLVREIPRNLELAKAVSQRVSLLCVPGEPDLSKAQLQLQGAPPWRGSGRLWVAVSPTLVAV